MTNIENRLCPKCQTEKPLCEFYSWKEPRRRGGVAIDSRCKKCANANSIAHAKRRFNTDAEFREKTRATNRNARSRKQPRITAMFGSAKNRALKYNIPFCITKADISALAEKQNWTCAKTGISLNLTSGQGGQPFGPSLDRIDNDMGYEPGNIQLVCYMYNMAKNQFGDADVLAFSQALIEHQKTAPNKLRIVA